MSEPEVLVTAVTLYLEIRKGLEGITHIFMVRIWPVVLGESKIMRILCFEVGLEPYGGKWDL